MSPLALCGHKNLCTLYTHFRCSLDNQFKPARVLKSSSLHKYSKSISVKRQKLIRRIYLSSTTYCKVLKKYNLTLVSVFAVVLFMPGYTAFDPSFQTPSLLYRENNGGIIVHLVGQGTIEN